MEVLGAQGVLLVIIQPHTNVVPVVDRQDGPLTFVGVEIQMREGRLRGRAGMRHTRSRYPRLITEIGVEGHGSRAEGLWIVWTKRLQND